jgi:hypothetical protein
VKISQNSSLPPTQLPAEKLVRDIRRAARKHHSAEETWQKIGALIDIVSPNECSNYLANSGYASA